MKVIVCGGRDLTDMAWVARQMDAIHTTDAIHTLIQGGATGADRLARRWAYTVGIKVKEYPADWSTHGPAAGPIRNQQMLDAERPDLVVAFPGGRGTADMVRRAKAAGVRVVEIKRQKAPT